MILQALVDYYEQQSREHPEKIARPGWCTRQIAFMLELSPEGELVGILPAEDKHGWTKTVPEQIKRAVNITSNLFCDNATYLLGLDNKGKPERTRRCFEDARRKHLELLANVDSVAACAIRSFFESWDVEHAAEHPCVIQAGDALLAGGNLVFFVGGREALSDPELCAAWDRRYDKADEDAAIMTCLVTGERAPVARLHPAIKGVMGAQAMGASLVGFNARAFESYGHDEEQGLNAPVSERATFAYTTALNYLLSDRKHHMRLGDTTIVYWASECDEECSDWFSRTINPDFGSGQSVVEDDAEEKLDAIMNAVALGRQVENATLDATFYVLGLAPNAARLSVRFFLCDTFGAMLDNLRKHYDRIDVARAPYEKKYLSPYFLLAETANPNAKQPAATSVLAGSLMRSILGDLPYPEALYSNTLLRVRATQDNDDRRTRKITRGRAAIIKAYLLKNNKEAVTVSLDETRNDAPYVLGRLFSVLERVQEEANPAIKATIKNRYFDSANATPAVVFPVIMKLGQNHLNKIASDRKGLAVFCEKQIQELCDKVQSFPKRLTLAEQGDFILGYYHQTQKRYEKKNDQEA